MIDRMCQQVRPVREPEGHRDPEHQPDRLRPGLLRAGPGPPSFPFVVYTSFCSFYSIVDCWLQGEYSFFYYDIALFTAQTLIAWLCFFLLPYSKKKGVRKLVPGSLKRRFFKYLYLIALLHSFVVVRCLFVHLRLCCSPDDQDDSAPAESAPLLTASPAAAVCSHSSCS